MSAFARPAAGTGAGAGSQSPTRDVVPSAAAVSGWVTFSGVMLILAGLANLVDGLWALDVSDSSAIPDQVEDRLWYSSSLETWGWVYAILGAVLVVVAIGVLAKAQWARWIGVFAASVSLVVNMMWVFVYPVASLIHVGLASMVVYGLTTGYFHDAYGPVDRYDGGV